MPGEHGEQRSEGTERKWPSSHSWHVLLPTDDNWPTGSTGTLPNGQLEHAAWPSWSVNVATGHATQAVAWLADWYVPTAHGTQLRLAFATE